MVISDDCFHTEPLEIGGHTALSQIPPGYSGPCGVFEESSVETLICAFPSPVEAMRAAWYATTPDGGYGSVVVRPCDADRVTHSTFPDWAF